MHGINIMKLNYIILLPLLLLSIPAQSTKYTWPVVTGVTVSLTGNTYNLKTNWTPYQFELSESEEKLSPCTTSNCRVAVLHRHNTSSVAYPAGKANLYVSDAKMNPTGYVAHKSGSTWRDILLNGGIFMQAGSMTWPHNASNAAGNECQGIALVDTLANDLGPWDANLNRLQYPSGMQNISSCFITPPANEWCALNTPSIKFSYGILTIGNTSTHLKKTSAASVYCTSGIKYILKLRLTDEIPLSNGMKARITANQTPLGTTIDGIAGDNILEIESTLTGAPERTGVFEGTGVLYVSYP